MSLKGFAVLKKRLVGVVTVRNGWAVQSFGYRQYLPLGRAELLVENLDRWGADEILLQCIDRSHQEAGPDLDLLERVSRRGLATPLIYAGGVRNADDAIAVIKTGADRVCVDALLHESPITLQSLAKKLGAQAIIASLPLSIAGGGEPLWLDYRSGHEQVLKPEVVEFLDSGYVSEVLIIDWVHEGRPVAFDSGLVARFPARHIPLIAFGGLSEAYQLRQLLEVDRVSAVAVGNALNYREHNISKLKAALIEQQLRPHHIQYAE